MAGTLAYFDLTYGGVLITYSGATVVLRAPQESQDREIAWALELDTDFCANTFGVAPCTATGVPCYNTFKTCKDQPNFIKTVKTYKFCSEGMLAPVGELVRPYIPRNGVATAPTVIQPGEGLAIRSQTKIALKDEPDSDYQMDPYRDTRLSGSTTTIQDDFSSGSTSGYTVVGTGASHSIVSGAYRLSTSAGNVGQSRVDGAPTHADGLFEIDIAVPSVSALTGDVGLIYRTTYWSTPASKSFGYLMQLMQGVIRLAVGSNDASGGFATVLSSQAHAFSAGTVVKIRVEYVGSRHRIYINGVNYIDTTDSTWMSGQLGLRGFDGSSSHNWDFDNLFFQYAISAQTVGGTFWRRFQARNLYTVGRHARLRRGYVVNPFNWNDFSTELFVIDAISGPDRNGNMTVVLSDFLRLADKAQFPTPTSGKLSADMENIVNAGNVVSGTTTSVTISDDASPTDEAYTGMELYIYAGVGSGQRAPITTYDGDTRTVSVSLQVAPDTSSSYQISALSVNVGDDRGGQYGGEGYIRIGDEIIRFTSRSGDVLSWPNSTYRGQFGTDRDDHSESDNVQLCKAWNGDEPNDVLVEILNAAGISSTYIDLAGLAQEASDWMPAAEITTCLSVPEKCSQLLKELSTDLNLMLWWDPAGQKVRGKVNVPQLAGTVTELTDDDLMGTEVQRQDADRITEAAQYYGLRTATSNKEELKNYDYGEIRIDEDAESANEYGDVRQDVAVSRWLSAGNTAHVGALVGRRVNYFRDAPHLLKLRADPRTVVEPGELVDITTRYLTDFDGNAATKSCRITKVDDRLTHKELEAVTTTFGDHRWGFIAPSAAPDFDVASDSDKVYMYISNGTEMPDGTDAYRII